MYKVFFDNKKIWVTNNLRKARKKKGKLFSLTTLSVKDFDKKANLKCKTTKNNIISSYKEDYFFDRKIREDRVLDALDRLF